MSSCRRWTVRTWRANAFRTGAPLARAISIRSPDESTARNVCSIRCNSMAQLRRCCVAPVHSTRDRTACAPTSLLRHSTCVDVPTHRDSTPRIRTVEEWTSLASALTWLPHLSRSSIACRRATPRCHRPTSQQLVLTRLHRRRRTRRRTRRRARVRRCQQPQLYTQLDRRQLQRHHSTVQSSMHYARYPQTTADERAPVSACAKTAIVISEPLAVRFALTTLCSATTRNAGPPMVTSACARRVCVHPMQLGSALTTAPQLRPQHRQLPL